MAANEVAKISVGIEAKVDNLANDLQSAEKVVRTGAKNIENTVERASQKIERSWTEAFSKMGFIQQVASIAMQAFKAVEGVVKALGDESLNASQKITGSLDAIEQANVPVLSQFLSMGRGIHEMITGEAALEAQISRTNAQYAKRAQEQAAESNARREISAAISSQLAEQERYNELQEKSTEEAKLRMKQVREMGELEASLNKKLREMKKGMTEERIASERETIARLLQEKQEQHDRELESARKRDEALEQSNQDRLNNENKAAEKAEETKRKLAEDAAKAVADKTSSLQHQLRQAELRGQGEIEQAAIEAIEHRFEKMRQSVRSLGAANITPETTEEERKTKKAATEEQVRMIDRLQELEVSAATAKKLEKVIGTAEKQEAGGTATLSTAIGGFMVATGTSPELRESKKQTTLLEQIGENTTPKQGGAVIIAAA